ncbi:hypothetical protein [Staphylococcus kloosii]|jgi:hypothetical protein|uniref:hypothetical protein n=1 Tax=Staphylococcus kloosii TaxID=29384 RepID=UPI0018A0AA7C|nr:hypothetical protein [Staphylococcus kloosii]MBF7025966.1 hypothetical protein [Staphylococcus kloosii]
MNEPTEIKYPLDENGEPYYAAAHIKGLYGLDFDGDDNLAVVLLNLQSTITDLKNKVDSQNITISDLQTQVDENTKAIKALSGK